MKSKTAKTVHDLLTEISKSPLGSVWDVPVNCEQRTMLHDLETRHGCAAVAVGSLTIKTVCKHCLR